MTMSRRLPEEPTMSDTTVLISVENMINIAMGPPGKNTINYKMMQTVLHIIARQLRMLETQVEIRISEEEKVPKEKIVKPKKSKSTAAASASTAGPTSPDQTTPPKQKTGKSRHTMEKEDKYMREKESKDLRADAREREAKDSSADSKEREPKDSRAESKEREPYDLRDAKEKDPRDKKEKDPRDIKEKDSRDAKYKSPRDAKEKDPRDVKDKSSRDVKEKESHDAKEKYSRDAKEEDYRDTKDKDSRGPKEKEYLDTKEKVTRDREKDTKDEDSRGAKEKDSRDKKDKDSRDMNDKDSRGSKDKDFRDTKDSQSSKDKDSKGSKDKDSRDTKDSQSSKDKDSKSSKDKESRVSAEKDSQDSKERESKGSEVSKDYKEKDLRDAKDKPEAYKDKEGKLKDKRKEEKDAKEKWRDDKIEERESAPKGKKDKEKLKEKDTSPKDKYQAPREKEEVDRGRPSVGGKGQKSVGGISITETERNREKVLVVEKGPTTRSTDSRTRVGSIEVVTLSQFEMLEALVRELRAKAGPLPLPALPDNRQLRRDLATGSASLTDTMQAMQVSARVQAAEQAIGRLAGLLEASAAAGSGAVPSELRAKLVDIRSQMEVEEPPLRSTTKGRSASSATRKSVAIDPMAKDSPATLATPARSATPASSVTPASSATPSSSAMPGSRPSTLVTKPSLATRPSLASRASSAMGALPVTHPDMDDALRVLKDELTRNITVMTSKATAAAESASTVARGVADKLDLALKLNARINHLSEMVNDYAEQLSGFDSGLTTQMQSFQEQMMQMRSDLKTGLDQLQQANSNAETAAVMELTERYEGLALELDNTLSAHNLLTSYQKQLGDDLRSLLEAVEMLREQKADRDEVLDGLRDKADISRLEGLLSEPEFNLARAELERRLELCYEKFQKQEAVWMAAIRDLTSVSEQKAELMQLLAARDDAGRALNAVQDQLAVLAHQLGEPKAALLTRLLSRDGACGACLEVALMEPTEPAAARPPALPPLRPPPARPEPCAPDWRLPQFRGIKEHACHRWVGGSHTLVTDAVSRARAPPAPPAPPAHKYAGYGSDGRLYLMEEELQPCIECNKMSADAEVAAEAAAPAQFETGAGDGAVATVMVFPDQAQ